MSVDENPFSHAPWTTEDAPGPRKNTRRPTSWWPPSWRPPTWIIVVVAAAIALVIIALIINPARRNPTAGTTPAASQRQGPQAAPATPATLPVSAPAGWTTTAAWSTSNRQTGSGVAVTGDTVWSLGSDSTLEARNGSTGTVTFIGHLPPSATGPWLSTVDGKPVIITLTPTTLTWRPADTPASTHTIKVPSGGTAHITAGCTWIGKDREAGIITGSGLATRTLPTGAQVAGCSASTLIAADLAGHVWSLTGDGAPGTPDNIEAPAGSDAQAIIGAQNGLLAIDYHLKGGKWELLWWNLSRKTTVGITNHAPELRLAGDTGMPRQNRYTGNSGIILDWQKHTIINPHGTLQAVIGDRAWSTQSGRAIVTDLVSDTTTSIPTQGQPATPAGLTGNKAVVLADDTTGTPTLYILNPR